MMTYSSVSPGRYAPTLRTVLTMRLMSVRRSMRSESGKAKDCGFKSLSMPSRLVQILAGRGEPFLRHFDLHLDERQAGIGRTPARMLRSSSSPSPGWFGRSLIRITPRAPVPSRLPLCSRTARGPLGGGRKRRSFRRSPAVRGGGRRQSCPLRRCSSNRRSAALPR